MARSPRIIAVLHDLRSLHNVGSIFRTADGAGIDEIIISGYTGTPPDPRISKVALGAEDSVAWRHVPDLRQLLDLLHGVHVIVMEQDARSVSVGALELPAGRDVALVACSELTGAPDELLHRADTICEIPMAGAKQSLNVAIAFGIAAYAVVAVIDAGRATLQREGPPRPVREGVLTLGVTTGEVPGSRMPGHGPQP